MRSDHNPHVRYFLQLVNGGGLQRLQRAEINTSPAAVASPTSHGCPAHRKRAKVVALAFFSALTAFARTLAPFGPKPVSLPAVRRNRSAGVWTLSPFCTSWSIIAHPVYIHRPARHKMFETLCAARRQIKPAGATGNSCAFNALYVRSATPDGALETQSGRVSSGAFGQNHVDHT